jgi:hypothetical protein
VSKIASDIRCAWQKGLEPLKIDDHSDLRATPQFDLQSLGPMNSLATHNKPHQDFPPLSPEQMSRLLVTAHSILEQVTFPLLFLVELEAYLFSQPPPPSLREILTAYRTKGDGDRDMLLAMLSAKTAEDQVGLFLDFFLFFAHFLICQRLSSTASLHRTVLEICQQATPSPPDQSSFSANGASHYPTPSFTQSPPLCDRQSSCHTNHRHHAVSYNSSPLNPHPHLPPLRDLSMTHDTEHRRKRHRSSRSPHRPPGAAYENSTSERFPPSPYSSSNQSEGEYSPPSRASMTIGSLLSSRPSRETDIPHHVSGA